MKRARSASRTATKDDIFGYPAELPQFQLPTYEDAMKCFAWERKRITDQQTQEYPSNRSVCTIVAKKIISLWRKASIPTITEKKVVDRLLAFYEESRLGPGKKKQKKSKQAIPVEQRLKLLFDNCTCKCSTLLQGKCTGKVKHEKVPQMEVNFLQDQRKARKMMIGGVDLKVTKINTKRLLRDSKRSSRKKSSDSTDVEYQENADEEIPEENGGADTSSGRQNDKEYLPATRVLAEVEPSSSQMRKSLPHFAMAVSRTGVTPFSAPLLGSALLEDLGLIIPDDKSLTIDRSKVICEKQKIGKSFQHKDADVAAPISALFFDGRKDKTLYQEVIGKSRHRRTRVEEHISLIEEPGSTFLGHVSPVNGRGSMIAESIFDYFSSHKMQTLATKTDLFQGLKNY